MAPAPSAPGRMDLRKRKGGSAPPPPAAAPAAHPPPPPGLATFQALRADPTFHFLADNEAIHTGYRRGLSPWAAVKSAFSLHNETVNIWTHGLGALLFASLFVSFLLYELPGAARGARHLAHDVEATVHGALTDAMHLPRGSAVPTWPLGVFILSAVVCLSLSTAFHTLHIVDEFWFRTLSSLDYSGIAVLIWGSTVPMLELGFHCHPRLGAAYTAAGTAIALGTCYVGVSPAFRTTAYRKVRMSCFIATGCYGALPYLHLAALGEPVYPGALPRLLLMGGLYITGALLYGFRLPEAAFPGRFDRWLQSHNIFHVCVVAACWVHYQALVANYAWREAHAECAPA